MKKNKKANAAVYTVLSLLFAAVIILALLNRGDAELRQALEENREFQILIEGEHAATVSLNDLLALNPADFTTKLATSTGVRREAALRGVELKVLMEAMGLNLSGAKRFTVSGLDGYYSALTREEVFEPETIYICYAMDGEILKPRGGGGIGPFLMVIRGSAFAQRWCKYVEAIDISLE